MHLGYKPVHLDAGRDFENKWFLYNSTLFCHKKTSYCNQRNKTEGIMGSFIFFPFSQF